jgi:acyl-CoA dehydrogenase
VCLAGAPGSVSVSVSVSQIEAHVPLMVHQVVGLAVQLHGGAGLSNDFPLAGPDSIARARRPGDGPGEVDVGVVARLELRRYLNAVEEEEA